MNEVDELTEKVAIALWQSDSMRVRSKPRNALWDDQHEAIKSKFRTSANAAIDACEVTKLKSHIQDMFTELHAFADNSNFVTREDQQRWRDGEITIIELVSIGRESMS